MIQYGQRSKKVKEVKRMVLSEQIAKMLEEMLDEAGGELSLGRNELASRLGCVPSQINYVITSRFTPARGYTVESRRGGGGYIRITRLKFDRRRLLLHFYDAVGASITERDAAALIRLADEMADGGQRVRLEKTIPAELRYAALYRFENGTLTEVKENA